MAARLHTLLVACACLAAAAPDVRAGSRPEAAEPDTLAFRSVSAGRGFVCATSTTFRLYCWGAGFPLPNGQRPEDLTWQRCGLMPCRMSPFLIERAYGRATSVTVSVSSGENVLCMLDTLALAWCWGAGSRGQLASSFGEDRRWRPPEQGNSAVVLLDGNFTALSAAADHVCGVASNGYGYCWGAGGEGQLGTSQLSVCNTSLGSIPCRSDPGRVAGGLLFRSIQASEGFSCGLTTEGAAYCWGLNTGGRLGSGASANSDRPVAIAGGRTFRALAVGDGHACAVATDGSAWCWGRGDEGQLGTGNRASSGEPVAVSGGRTFRAVAAGARFTCALDAEGAAWCWGRGRDGQLGTTTPADQAAPVAVAGGVAFQSLALGYDQACGLTAAGAIWCWGKGGWGTLGNGARRDSPTPVQVVAAN